MEISLPTKGGSKVFFSDEVMSIEYPKKELSLKEFLERYRLEPRGDVRYKWFVIFDKKNKTYVKDMKSKSKRAYLKISNTDTMLENFLKNNLI